MRLSTILVATALLSGGLAFADSPLQMREGLQMPAVLLKPTPPELIEVHKIGHQNPRQLLRFISPEWFERADGEASQEVRWRCRRYAIHLIGDIGGTDVIPELERIAERYRQKGQEQLAFIIYLTTERIRYRAIGRDAYIKEMVRWIQWPQSSGDPNTRDYEHLDRVGEGARALGVIRAKEAVPELLEVWRRPEWGSGPWSLLIVRPLTRIGDRRAMEAIEYEMRAMFMPTYPAEQVPLEPGEPDPGCVYWQWRTEGMTLQQAVDTLVRSMASSYAKIMEEKVLRNHVGPAAAPHLLKFLSNPPSGESSEVALGKVAELLGEWRVKEALPRLRELVRSSESNFVVASSVIALGRIADTESLEDVIALAKREDNARLQLAAIIALGMFSDSRAVETLLDLFLNSPHAGVRASALRELQNHGDRKTLSVLEERLQNEQDEAMRRSIRFTMERIRERLR